MVKICGIDEAGRGPVIGPLVICGTLIETKQKNKLKKLGIKDSKLLSPKKREEIYEQIKDSVEHEVIAIKPDEIDKSVSKNELNKLEAKHSGIIVEKLRASTAILDCPTANKLGYSKDVREFMNKDNKCKLICEFKADLNYIEVACASIIAKVTRDNIIKEMHKEYGDFGSGYPSDPKTKEFVSKNYKKYKDEPELFRKQWQTYKDAVEKNKQKSLGDFWSLLAQTSKIILNIFKI